MEEKKYLCTKDFSTRDVENKVLNIKQGEVWICHSPLNLGDEELYRKCNNSIRKFICSETLMNMCFVEYDSDLEVFYDVE